MSSLQKRIQSLVDSARKAKAALTRKVVGVYILWTLLAAVGFEIALSFFAPADVPPPIIRLGSSAWGVITVVLTGGVLTLLAVKEVRDKLKGSLKFVEASFVTSRVRYMLLIASLVTGLLYPLYQVIAANAAPPRATIPNTPYSGTLVVNDPLTSNRLGWGAVPSQQNACKFTAAGYEVRAGSGINPQICLADKTNFSDFALQVEMTLMTGDIGGILFRDSYVLNLTSNPVEGTVDLEALSTNGHPTYLLSRCSSPLQIGCSIGESLVPQKTVSITIIARGTSIELYIDSARFRLPPNGVSSTGRIGILAALAGEKQTDALFANLRIWTNVA